MAKTRKAIPKAVSEAVLKEFNHKCAVCGKERPQIHHIDEDPSNNDPLNLIPLCPNCHLIDQHNPTIPIDPEKLRLFREYRDPTILKPQFHPLFKRMEFLCKVTIEPDALSWTKQCVALIQFVANLKMGDFYSKRVRELLPQSPLYAVELNESGDKQYRNQAMDAQKEVYELIVEQLRFQEW
jgi:hypothetical protein